MFFEFDPEKSASNKDKHGIDFIEAQALWLDEFLAEAPAIDRYEPRFMAAGLTDTKYWTAICIYRGGNIRIISVRRSRAQEINHYEMAKDRRKV